MASKNLREKSIRGESSSSSVPYSVMVRRERSRELAQKRRTTYKTIMDDLTQVLPFPEDVVSQLDYNSRLRLALCFFRLKTLVDHAESVKRYSSPGMHLQKSYTHDTLFQPGMLQDLMTEALDGFLLVTLVDGTIVYLSESIHKHLGLFQSEHIGISMYDLILEDDHLDVRGSISEAEAKALSRTSSKGSAEVSFFCRMKCSRFKVANTVTKNPGHKLVYTSGNLKVSGSDPFMVVVVRPVSPPSILEIRMEGNMFVTHYLMDMKCTFFDGRLYQMLGYNKPDLVGNVPFHLHHHDDEEATMQCSVGVMSRGEGLSGYYRFLTKFGTYLWLQTRATVMHDSRTGKPSYIVCMNFVINKQDGERELLKRQAITATVEPNVHVEDTRSHDPFPLVTREDGKVVNPFEESSTLVKSELLSPDVNEFAGNPVIKKEEASPTSDIITSVSVSPGSSDTPDSQEQDTASSSSSVSSFGTSQLAARPTSVSPEEPCLPDSTTTSQSVRVHCDSQSHDMGYYSDVSSKPQHRFPSDVTSSVISPALSGIHSDSSRSICHSGTADMSPNQNTSPYGPPSVFSERSSKSIDELNPTIVSNLQQPISHLAQPGPQTHCRLLSSQFGSQQPYSFGNTQPHSQQTTHVQSNTTDQHSHHVSTLAEPLVYSQTFNSHDQGGGYALPDGNPQNIAKSFPEIQGDLPSLPLLTTEDLKVLDYIEQVGTGESVTNVSQLMTHQIHH